VTPEVFLAVLKGDKDFVKGKGNGRVLETGPQDKIFVFFSDHGSVGLIAFPTKYLYATAMIPVLDEMAAKNRFDKFVFYLEACESGSMF
jgi:legumain